MKEVSYLVILEEIKRYCRELDGIHRLIEATKSSEIDFVLWGPNREGILMARTRVCGALEALCGSLPKMPISKSVFPEILKEMDKQRDTHCSIDQTYRVLEQRAQEISAQRKPFHEFIVDQVQDALPKLHGADRQENVVKIEMALQILQNTIINLEDAQFLLTHLFGLPATLLAAGLAPIAVNASRVLRLLVDLIENEVLNPKSQKYRVKGAGRGVPTSLVGEFEAISEEAALGIYTDQYKNNPDLSWEVLVLCRVD